MGRCGFWGARSPGVVAENPLNLSVYGESDHPARPLRVILSGVRCLSSGSLPLEGRAGEGVEAKLRAQSALPNPPPQGEGTR